MRVILALLLLCGVVAGKPSPAQLNTNHPLYANVVGLWALSEPAPTASVAVIASPLSTAFNGVAGVLPERVNDATYGPVARFTGTEYFNCGNVADFERTDAFSICVVFKPFSTDTDDLLGKQSTSPRGWSVTKNSTNVLLGLRCSTAGNILVYAPHGGTGAFTHAVFTYDGGSVASGLKGYIAGSDAGATTETTVLASSMKSGTNMLVGAVRSAAPDPFKGDIAFVAIFNRVLTPTEVADLYRRPFALLNRGYAGGMRMRYLINNRIFK